MQSVALMDVVPLTTTEEDESIAPPEVEVSNRNYGHVRLRNLDEERTTFVPPGSAWVVKQAAQDHAIGGGVLVPKRTQADILTARCIESSQGGTIRADQHALMVLPAQLRIPALAMRNTEGYSSLWPAIESLNRTMGVPRPSAHLAYFLKHFEKELDQFVAEFELVPNQVGALVFVAGTLVGIERAPNHAYWEHVWTPLIRLCYGAVALEAAKAQLPPPRTRVPLGMPRPQEDEGVEDNLERLRFAMEAAEAHRSGKLDQHVERLHAHQLASTGPEQSVDEHTLETVASDQVTGQLVRRGDTVVYGSMTTVGQQRS